MIRLRLSADHETAPTGLLGVVHRGVRVPQHVTNRGVRRPEPDRSDARRCLRDVVVEHDRLGDRVTHPLGQLRELLVARHLGDEAVVRGVEELLDRRVAVAD